MATSLKSLSMATNDVHVRVFQPHTVGDDNDDEKGNPRCTVLDDTGIILVAQYHKEPP